MAVFRSDSADSCLSKFERLTVDRELTIYTRMLVRWKLHIGYPASMPESTRNYSRISSDLCPISTQNQPELNHNSARTEPNQTEIRLTNAIVTSAQ